MAKIHKFKTTIYNILKSNKDGAYETQARRRKTLYNIAEALYAGGYKLTTVLGLKTKHILYLNELWKESDLSAGTIKNRNACLRWLAGKINKQNIVPSNEILGVARRQYVASKNRAIELKGLNLSKITNKNVYVQIHLQRYLGLRREESCKFKPYLADRGDHVYLYKSWCKGGRDRKIPITSKEARYWIDEAKKVVDGKNSSLIPSNKTYKQHREVYNKQIQSAGIKFPHGLRHAYAQMRFKELTGFDCPACGGPTRGQLTKKQQQLDYQARKKISTELGHGRVAIVAVYI